MNINFGIWDAKRFYLNYRYNNLANKIINFIKEAGPDKYNRFYPVEALINFAINRKIYDNSIEYIYRRYVYDKLGILNIEEQELADQICDFVYIDEATTI